MAESAGRLRGWLAGTLGLHFSLEEGLRYAGLALAALVLPEALVHILDGV